MLASQAELLALEKVLATSHGVSRFPGLPGLSTFGNPLAHPSNAFLGSLPLPNFPRIEAIDYRIPRRSKAVRSLDGDNALPCMGMRAAHSTVRGTHAAVKERHALPLR